MSKINLQESLDRLASTKVNTEVVCIEHKSYIKGGAIKFETSIRSMPGLSTCMHGVICDTKEHGIDARIFDNVIDLKDGLYHVNCHTTTDWESGTVDDWYWSFHPVAEDEIPKLRLASKEYKTNLKEKFDDACHS